MSKSDFHYRMSVIADEMEDMGKAIYDGPVTDADEAIEVEEFMQRIVSARADIITEMTHQFEDVDFTEICAQ
jgi:hypothetical protein